MPLTLENLEVSLDLGYNIEDVSRYADTNLKKTDITPARTDIAGLFGVEPRSLYTLFSRAERFVRSTVDPEKKRQIGETLGLGEESMLLSPRDFTFKVGEVLKYDVFF